MMVSYLNGSIFRWMIIVWLVRCYGRYVLSYKVLKEAIAERGLKINRVTICRWVHEYGKLLAKLIKLHLKVTGKSWRVDEAYIKIKGIWPYLYRAVDKQGQTLDWMLRKTRNKKAAKNFCNKSLANNHVAKPSVVNIDQAATFVPAYGELPKSSELNSDIKLRRVKYLNTSIENDHKFVKSKSRYRQWYQSFETAEAAIDVVEAMRMI